MFAEKTKKNYFHSTAQNQGSKTDEQSKQEAQLPQR